MTSAIGIAMSQRECISREQLEKYVLGDLSEADWQAIAEHLAFNLAQGRPLNTLDGWADKENSLADVNDFHVDSVEEQEPEENSKPRKAGKRRVKRG